MTTARTGPQDHTNGAAHTIAGPFEEIIDTTTTAGYYYHCLAATGTKTAQTGWQISRFTVATGRTEWADGDGEFDNIADDRASLTYTEAMP